MGNLLKVERMGHNKLKVKG